jgi:hypothetical protein
MGPCSRPGRHTPTASFICSHRRRHLRRRRLRRHRPLLAPLASCSAAACGRVHHVAVVPWFSPPVEDSPREWWGVKASDQGSRASVPRRAARPVRQPRACRCSPSPKRTRARSARVSPARRRRTPRRSRRRIRMSYPLCPLNAAATAVSSTSTCFPSWRWPLLSRWREGAEATVVAARLQARQPWPWQARGARKRTARKQKAQWSRVGDRVWSEVCSLYSGRVAGRRVYFSTVHAIKRVKPSAFSLNSLKVR